MPPLSKVITEHRDVITTTFIYLDNGNARRYHARRASIQTQGMSSTWFTGISWGKVFKKIDLTTDPGV